MKYISEAKRVAAQPRPDAKVTTGATPRRSQSARKNEASALPRSQARSAQSAERNYQRYLTLARAEAVAGNRITAEGYFQHAEHYFRSMAKNEN
jgi:hypothetical protein